jgi:hypothetical protein
MSYTTDRNNPDLKYGVDNERVEQNKAYLVLTDEELSKGFIKPFRNSYKHLTCGTLTTMGEKIADTYATDPWFYGATYCCYCMKHRPLSEFVWEPDGESMNPSQWSAEEVNRIVELRKKMKEDIDE